MLTRISVRLHANWQRWVGRLAVVILSASLVSQSAEAQVENTISWGGWNARLGGDASGGLTLVLRPPNLSTVFAVGADRILRFRHWNGSRWTPWTAAAVNPVQLDGSGIDAVASRDDRIDLVVRDSRGHVLQTYGNVDDSTNRWGDWSDLGRTLGPPTITKTASDRLQIFALGPNNIVLWQRWERDHWLNNKRWDFIRDGEGRYPRMRDDAPSPRLTGQFAAVKELTLRHERIDLIARTVDGRLMQAYWNGSHWSGFADLSESLAGRFTEFLAATSPALGRLEFLAQVDDGSIHWKRWNNGWLFGRRWLPLTNPDAQPGLRARAQSDCRTDVVSRDPGNGVLYGYTRCDPEKALDVTVTLRELKVHDDCDNVSAGDWFVGFAAGTPSMARSGSLPQSVFPNSNSAVNIDTGETLRIGRTIRLADVPRTESVVAGVGALDCDGDSIITLTLPGPWGQDTGGLSLFRPVQVDCDWEEEEFEWSGDDDALGDAVVELAPGQWQHGGIFEVPAETPIQSGCFTGGAISDASGRFGPPAYTAVFDVSTQRRPR